MIKGYLKIAVLHELAKGSCSGYKLMNSIALTLGKRPSSGSIYPLLSELVSTGYISSKDEDRKKIYSLSSKGKSSISKILAEKEEVIEKHAKFCSVVEHFTKVKTCFHRKNRVVMDNLPIIAQIKEIMINLDEKKGPIVNKILKKTLNDLRKIK